MLYGLRPEVIWWGVDCQDGWCLVGKCIGGKGN